MIMRNLGYLCDVQIVSDTIKPFLSARVKFDSEAHLQLALCQHRTFSLR